MQRQRVLRSRRLIAGVPGLFKLLARFVFVAEAHQVECRARAAGFTIGIEFERLAVRGDAFFVAAIDDEEVRGDIIGFAVVGIDFENFRRARACLFCRPASRWWRGWPSRPALRATCRAPFWPPRPPSGRCCLRAPRGRAVPALRTSLGSISSAASASVMALACRTIRHAASLPIERGGVILLDGRAPRRTDPRRPQACQCSRYIRPSGRADAGPWAWPLRPRERASLAAL